MTRIKLANIILFVTGLALTVIGFVLLTVDETNAPPPNATAQGLPETREQILAAGAKLVSQHNCNFCHRTELPASHPPRDNCQLCHQKAGRVENLAPPLEHVAERRSTSWIRRYLRYPYAIRTNSADRMPDFSLSDFDIEVLVGYLGELGAERIAKLPGWRPQREATPDAARMAAADELFHAKLCGTCHSLGSHIVKPEYGLGGQAKVVPVIFAPPLDRSFARVRPEWLAAAIREPGHWLPWSGMTQVSMTEAEARELAWFLMNQPTHEPVSSTEVMSILRGRCNGCHYGPDEKASPATNPLGGAGWLATWSRNPRELDLWTIEGVMRGAKDDLGNLRPSVVPYAENSPLLMHLKGHKQPSMPFGGDPLPAEEIEKIERWILSGAPVPTQQGGITVNPPIEMGD